MISSKDDGTITMVQGLREIRGKTDRHSVHTMACDVSEDKEGGVRGWKGGCCDKKPVCSFDQGITDGLYQMGSHLRYSKMVGRKDVKRLGDAQKLLRQKKLTSTNASRFLIHLISELADRLPEMSMSRAGMRFRKILGKNNKAKPPVVESCTMLIETMKISDSSYCVTNIIMPRRAAALAGVTSLEFWNDEKEMTEEDFFQENDDLKADLTKLS